MQQSVSRQPLSESHYSETGLYDDDSFDHIMPAIERSSDVHPACLTTTHSYSTVDKADTGATFQFNLNAKEFNPESNIALEKQIALQNLERHTGFQRFEKEHAVSKLNAVVRMNGGDEFSEEVASKYPLEVIQYLHLIARAEFIARVAAHHPEPIPNLGRVTFYGKDSRSLFMEDADVHGLRGYLYGVSVAKLDLPRHIMERGFVCAFQTSNPAVFCIARVKPAREPVYAEVTFIEKKTTKFLPCFMVKGERIELDYMCFVRYLSVRPKACDFANQMRNDALAAL